MSEDAMATQRIVWIALPNGLTNNGTAARVSVLVSPTLFGSQRLGDFDFVDWPARLDPTRVNFSVDVSGQLLPARVVSKASSARWGALFKEDDFVRNPPENLQGQRFAPIYSSYPVARLHDALKS